MNISKDDYILRAFSKIKHKKWEHEEPKIMSDFYEYKQEVQKGIVEMNNALKILEQIQTIKQGTVDRETLYKLLIKSEFNQNNYSHVEKEESFVIYLLSKLRYIYHGQKSLHAKSI